MQTIKQTTLTIIICLAVVAGVSLVSAWTGPTATPPDGNTPAPINVSATEQIKSGPLQVNGFRNLGSSIFDGNVGIGATGPNFGDSKVLQMTNWPRSVVRIDGGPTQSEIWAIGTEDVDNNLRIVNMTGLDLWPRNSTKGIIIKPSGEVGIGTTDPGARLDLGGGDIKMGYEIVSFSKASDYNSDIRVTCPAGKYLIGGGCTINICNMRANAPVDTTTWRCLTDTGCGGTAYAICANIR